MALRFQNSLIYLSLFILLFLSSISPKAFKIISGYSGAYPNPHLFLIILLLPILLYYRAFEFYRNAFWMMVLGLIISSVYWISATFAYISVDLYDEGFINPFIQSAKMSLTYALFIPFFLLLRNRYVNVCVNIYFILGVLHFLIFLYGELVFFGLIRPISEDMMDILIKDIYAQSYTILGFLPKWRGFFEETQIMATFYLMLFIFGYIRGLWFSWLFLVFSLYLFSKSAILATILFLFHVFLKDFLKLKEIYYRIVLLLSYTASFFLLLLIFLSKDLEKFSSLHEGGVENAASFHERAFHIIKTIEYMSEEPVSFLIGLGPRTYGHLLLQEYGDRFNVDSNAISFFTVFQDIGFLGFLLTIIYIVLLYRLIDRRDNTVKIAFLSLLISYLPQISWGHHIILAGLTLLVRLRRDGI